MRHAHHRIAQPQFRERAPGAIDILLMHYTGMPTAADALSRLVDAAAKVSCHYVVDETGEVYRLVPEEARAWHAGVAYWAGDIDINSRSIGIEIVNPGHEFGYRDFPEAQIAAVEELSLGILKRHPIPPSRVIGHSDIAPDRKEDPGERFPWARLAARGIGVWFNRRVVAPPDMKEGDLSHLFSSAWKRSAIAAAPPTRPSPAKRSSPSSAIGSPPLSARPTKVMLPHARCRPPPRSSPPCAAPTPNGRRSIPARTSNAVTAKSALEQTMRSQFAFPAFAGTARRI